MTPQGLHVRMDSAHAEQLLMQINKRTRDMRRFFGGYIDPEITKFFRKQFETAGAHGRSRWAPLRPLTVQLRKRRGHGFGGSDAPLIDTDTLRRAYVNVGGSIGFREITAQRYERGVNSLVAMLHQKGFVQRTIFGRTRKRPYKVPARQVIPDEMPKSILSQWEGKMVRYIETGVS